MIDTIQPPTSGHFCASALSSLFFLRGAENSQHLNLACARAVCNSSTATLSVKSWKNYKGGAENRHAPSRRTAGPSMHNGNQTLQQHLQFDAKPRRVFHARRRSSQIRTPSHLRELRERMEDRSKIMCQVNRNVE